MKLWTGALLVALGAILAAAIMLLWQKPDVDAEAPAAQVAAPAADGVRLDAATQKRLGIELVTLTSATAPVQEAGFARAIDVAPLAAIDGDIAIARAAAAASAADLARLSALAAADNSASARSVQVARAQAVADAARVGQAAQRSALEFVPGVAAFGDPARTRQVADVAA
ncbi:MAG: hypothetical protein H7268_00410, partial [Sandarakinorhabdus sp.]|nr:hypothetical protein [Sandarakinorhabdus sp.]